jgi:hypothetical protein
MKSFFGQGDQLVRFLLLTCGLLTLTAAVACLLMGNTLLAVACCIVSAWAIGTYLDTIYTGIIQASRAQRPTQDTAQEDRTPTA